MWSWWHEFSLALSLLTIIPLPVDGRSPRLGPSPQAPYREATGVRFFPVVGFLIGLILYRFDQGLSLLFSPFLKAALLLALNIIITGGLHLDGFVDTCDGLFSRWDRDRVLAIMRDSRVGGLGVVALVVLLLLKFTVLLELVGRMRPWALLFFPLLGRLGMTGAVCWFDYARPGAGMGRKYAQADKRDFAFASRLSLVLVIMAFTRLKPTPREAGLILVAVLVSLAGSHFFSQRLAAKLGGLTGDVYGAVNEVAELLFLLTVVGGAGQAGWH
jgi:adenosylcobinamide-GDP ribazoletransferase